MFLNIFIWKISNILLILYFHFFNTLLEMMSRPILKKINVYFYLMDAFFNMKIYIDRKFMKRQTIWLIIRWNPWRQNLTTNGNIFQTKRWRYISVGFYLSHIHPNNARWVISFVHSTYLWPHVDHHTLGLSSRTRRGFTGIGIPIWTKDRLRTVSGLSWESLYQWNGVLLVNIGPGEQRCELAYYLEHTIKTDRHFS